MRVNAGKLDKRITILRESKTHDADGYWTAADETVWTCWAQFSRTSGKEMTASNADYSEVSVRFLIRCPPVSIDRKMVVDYAGDRYEITYLNDYGDAREYTEIIAVLRTNRR